MQLLITHEENDFVYIATMVDFHALVSPVALNVLQGKGVSDEYLFCLLVRNSTNYKQISKRQTDSMCMSDCCEKWRTCTFAK